MIVSGDFSYERALRNWHRVFNKVRVIAKGYLVPGARILQDKHWIETIKLELSCGEHVLRGRVYPPSFPKELDPIKKYKRLNNITISFETYVQGKINSWKEKGKINKIKILFNSLQQICYFSDKVLKFLTPRLEPSGELIMPTPHLALWTTMVKKNSPHEIVPFEIFMKEAVEEAPLLLPEEEYIFILTCQKVLHIAFKYGDICHSSLSRGTAVLYAGKLRVQIIDGKSKIVSISTHSGHYRPTVLEVYTLIDCLEEKGVNTDHILFDIRTEVLEGKELKRRK